MRPAAAVAFVACLAAIAFLTWETRRLTALVGVAELRASELDAQLASAKVAAAATPPSAASAAPSPQPATIVAAQDPVAFAELSLELTTTKQQLARVTELLEQRNREAAPKPPPPPMPEGVRSCLLALHDCLRHDGYDHLRFLAATAVDAEGLHGVELLETTDDGLGSIVTVAARMTAMLDRAKSRLALRFFDGHRRVGGERQALGKDGFAVTFDRVDGPYLERALPMLVRCEGEYPAAAEAATAGHDLSPIDRAQWLERLDRLLADAGTTPLWRVSRLRGLHDANFLAVDLVGTDERFRVKAGASCERLAVEVDRERGIVSLWLRGGVLHGEGGESRIGDDGYRMLLPKLTPQKATTAMLGMVVSR
jgi:hypothetical protein